MKVTKSQLKQIIKEEIAADPALRSAIDNLASKIDSLDVSIDYLTSAITGEDAFSIGLSQKATGRMQTTPTRITVDENDSGETENEN
tara:strand:- start:941 stop:1201 length:261 start_codon:yes stop_codon:yes gene_type:complete